MDKVKLLDITYKPEEIQKLKDLKSKDLISNPSDGREDSEVLDSLFSSLIRKYEQVVPYLEDPKEILELTRAVSELKKAFSNTKDLDQDTEELSETSLSKFQQLLKAEF